MSGSEFVGRFSDPAMTSVAITPNSPSMTVARVSAALPRSFSWSKHLRTNSRHCRSTSTFSEVMFRRISLIEVDILIAHAVY